MLGDRATKDGNGTVLSLKEHTGFMQKMLPRQCLKGGEECYEIKGRSSF